ncbi:MAG: kelch repeat-containing protein [Acidimicrobiales bacterium]
MSKRGLRQRIIGSAVAGTLVASMAAVGIGAAPATAATSPRDGSQPAAAASTPKASPAAPQVKHFMVTRKFAPDGAVIKPLVRPAALPDFCTLSAGTETCTVPTGQPEALTIPSGIDVTVTLEGAAGGGGSDYGGNGGEVSGLWASNGDQLTINVGTAGGDETAGWPDGGTGAALSSPGTGDGCGGGGSTALSDGSTLLAIAGGGGGCGGNADLGSDVQGGAGGASGGGASGDFGACNGDGGSSGVNGGAGGSRTAGICDGGSDGDPGGTASNGASGSGGNGGAAGTGGGGGGGGGGGDTGGGGGAGAGFTGGGGAGGGGSNAFPGLTNATTISGGENGDGTAVLSWTLESTTTTLASTNPSSVDAGVAATLQASVTYTGSYVPTGTVEFENTADSSVLCSTSLSGTSSDDDASCSYTPDTAADITLDAIYEGDEGASGSTSGTATLEVGQDPTTVDPVAVTFESLSEVELSTTVYPATYSPEPLDGEVDFLASMELPDGTYPAYASVCEPQVSGATAGQSAAVSCDYDVTSGDSYEFEVEYVGDLVNAASSTSAPVSFSAGPASTSTQLQAAQPTEPYGAIDQLTATVTGIPAVDSPPGTVEFTTYTVDEGNDTTPTDVDCIGGTNPAAVDAEGQATCDVHAAVEGDASNLTDQFEATYSGDTDTTTSESTAIPVLTEPASSSTALSVEPATSGDTYVTVPITVIATITNMTSSLAPDGDVAFTEGGSPLSGCTEVTSSSTSGATATFQCTSAPTPSTLDALSFGATYCPVATTGTCENWTSSTSTTSYTPGADPTQVSLAAPAGATGGQSVALSATVSDQAGDAKATGTVDFTENSVDISGCTALGLTAGVATCDYTPTAGQDDTVVANYDVGTGSLTAASKSNSVVIGVSATPTITSLAVSTPAGGVAEGSTIPYGVPVTLTASVAAGSTAVTSGTVTFEAGGDPIMAGGETVCQTVAFSGSTASCTVSGLALGTYDLTAAFASSSAKYASSASPTTDNSWTIGPASTSTALAVGPDAGDAADIALTATVANASADSTAVPVGTVSFSVVGGSAIAGCTAVALATTLGGQTASCDVVEPGGTTSYIATFTPTAEFSSSTSDEAIFTLGAACSTTYAALWQDAGTTIDFGVGSLGTTSDSISVVAGAESSSCDADVSLPFSGASLSLFGGTLSGSSLSGAVVDSASGTPQLCFDSGSPSLPTGWGITPIQLSDAVEICLSITDDSGAFTVGLPVSGSLVIPDISVPFGSPDTSVEYQLTLEITGSTTPSLTASITPMAVPASSPYLDATVTVSLSGETVTATGSLTVYNLPFGRLNATFEVSAGESGSITGSITGTIPGPYSPVPGLSVSGITVTLSSAGGLSFSGTATFGASSEPVSLDISGGYSSGTFTLSITSTAVEWTPFSSLTVDASFSGSVTITTAGAVTFDVEAGTPPVSGSTPTPIVAWDPISGLSADIYCLALSYGMTPTCNGSADTTPADPTLSVIGSVTVGPTSNNLTVGIDGSFDLSSGNIDLQLDSSFSNPTITVANGLTLTLDSLSVSGELGGTITVDGSASADISALDETVTATVTNVGGPLVIAVSGVSLAKIGVPLTGFFAYASAPVASYATGDPTFGTVALGTGFNAFVIYTPSSAVTSALDAVGFSPGATIEFQANWAPGSSPTMTATLSAPTGFPFLSLPGGGGITGATLSYAADSLSITVSGSFPVPNESAAAVSLTLTVDTSTGAISGNATVTGLTVFGQAITNFTGSFTWSKASGFAGTITGEITGSFAPFPSLPALQLSDISISIGTAGLQVSGDASIAGLVDISLSGSLQSLSDWTATLSLDVTSWSPTPGLSINADLTGSVTDNNGTVTFELTASGSPLFSFSAGGVTVSVDGIDLGNSDVPSACTVGAAGDLFLAISGASVSVQLGSTDASVSLQGCFDITKQSADLSATIPSLAISAAGGDIMISAPTITLTESGGKLSGDVTLTLAVKMPTGSLLSTTVSYTQEPSDGFVVGAEMDLSNWLGSSAATAYVYYSSGSVTGFDTGDPSLGNISLTAGINFALNIQLSSTAVSDLNSMLGLDLSSASLVATATLDFSTSTYRLEIAVNLGSGIQLFSSNGTTLDLTSGDIFVQLSPTGVSFGVQLNAELHIPSPGSGGAASTVALTGQLTVGTAGINVSLDVGNCNDADDAWTNAFGDQGLTVLCASLGGGIAFEPPGINVSLSGTITSLPSNVASAIGYDPSGASPGPPISFAFSLDPFLLSLSIGTENSSTIALEPLEAFGQGTLIEVNYASLYISPTGATVGGVTYPAGVGLNFQGSIKGTSISVLADIGFVPPSINFQLNIAKFTAGGLTIGPVAIALQASTSPLSFSFSFTGGFTLGPGSATIIPGLLQVGGGLSANADIGVSTSGFTAIIWGSLSVSVQNYASHATCWEYIVFPYPCDWYWDSSGFSITIGKTGVSVTGSGITLYGDGYALTFDYSGSVSITTSGTMRRELEKQACSQPGDAQAAACAVSTSAGPSVGKWLGARQPLQAQSFAAVATLPGGDVLVAGGIGSARAPIASAEVYDTATGTWKSIASMPQARAGAAVAVLSNGDVLVAGGVGSGNSVLSSAVIYDPATGKWSSTGSLPFVASYPSTVVLGNGDVLVAGGVNAKHNALASAAVYDAATGKWSAVAGMGQARSFAASSLLPDGDVLVAGGSDGSTVLSSAEIFNPKSGKWSQAAAMPEARTGISAVTLDDSRVLVVGDDNNALLYDATTNLWAQTGGTSAPFAFESLVKLASGDVLAVGGDSEKGTTAMAELYDPTRAVWHSAGSLSQASVGGAAALLPDGDVLVADGSRLLLRKGSGVVSFANDRSAELFEYPTPWAGAVKSGLPSPAIGSSEGYYVGEAGEKWRIEVTQSAKTKNLYTGTITVNAGQFSHVAGVSLEKSDGFTVKGGTITFHFSDYGDIDGLQFTTPDIASQITFTLEIDGKAVAARQVYLGKSAHVHPESLPLVVYRVT